MKLDSATQKIKNVKKHASETLLWNREVLLGIVHFYVLAPIMAFVKVLFYFLDLELEFFAV